MDKVYVKGQKLFITTEEATYDGTFHSVDKGSNRLTVKDVVKHPSEEAFGGLFHFYRSEILNVQIMDPITSAWLTPGTEIVGNKDTSIIRGVQAPPAYRAPINRCGTIGIPQKEYQYYLDLLKTFKIIDDTDGNFDEALCEIMSHSVVGVSCEGTMFGRRGKISWLSVCCPESTEAVESSGPLGSPQHVKLYLFDVALMGTVAFSKGLRTFLEDKNSPYKVIHDCRLLSDCLYHQFDVILGNVFDTQVAEAVVHFPRTRPSDYKGMEKLMFTRSLSWCLINSLCLPRNLVYNPDINDGFLEKHLEIWYQRPITAVMAKAVTFQSIYLLHLWNIKCQVKSSDVFNIGMKIYLSCVRDADDDTAFLMTNYYHLIPNEFIPLVLEHHNSQRRHRSRYGQNKPDRMAKESREACQSADAQ